MPSDLHARPKSRASLPRRFKIVLGVTAGLLLVAIVSITSSGRTPSVPTVADIKETAQQAAHIIVRPDLPQLWNPFGENAHEPLEQANSTHGDSRWFSDLNWLNPFSWSRTLSADRTLLPLLDSRTPIYTYYAAAKDSDKDLVAAENELILRWRRAWWAQGFRPVVLGHGEATKHPLFKQTKDLEMDPKMRRDVERWLAWSHMNGGVMSNWLVFPMAAYNDATLVRLRNRDYEKIRRFKNLKEGLLCGKKLDIDAALEQVLKSESISKAKTVNEVLPSKLFDVETKHDGVAFYDSHAIASKYKAIMASITESEPKGLRALGDLINSHLHIIWQNSFPDGISVLTPHQKHVCTLSGSALKVATRLAQCAESLMPVSCPPTKRSCLPCDSRKPMKITTPGTFVNKTSTFTIGTVPHPYTLNSLAYMRAELDVAFIRRQTNRDSWLTHMTREALGSIFSGPQRLVGFKEIVASPQTSWRSLWVHGERNESEPLDLDFQFGFVLPPPLIDAEAIPAIEFKDEGIEAPNETESRRERYMIQHSQQVLEAKSGDDHHAADMVMSWNMADTEAWRFVKAYSARRIVERMKWEEEERRFAGAEKTLGWFEKPKPGL